MSLTRLIMIFAAVLILGACNTAIQDKIDPQLKQQTTKDKDACDRGECPCDTPVGSVAHRSKITTYSRESVPCNEGCGQYAEELACSNGEFDKKIVGRYFKCNVEECPACQLGQNLILSGETVETYSKDTVGCQESCEDFKQPRKCQMGVLSGDQAYHFFSCKRKLCRCELPDSSGYISLDGEIKLYRRETASCGTTCNADHSQVRKCVSTFAGTPPQERFELDGSPSYRYRACNEATNCWCTLPNSLGILFHNQTRRIWKIASVVCGQTCNSQELIEVKCDNGTFRNNADLNVVIDFSSAAYFDYRHQCQEESCQSCPVPNTAVSVLHGQAYRFYSASSVACGNDCQYQDRTCNNGTFLGDAGYWQANCSVRTCTCDVPGLSGIKVNVGSPWKFYSAAQAACGQTCQDISTDKICAEIDQGGGNFVYQFLGSPAFSHVQCAPPTGCSCALPNQLGQILDTKVVTLTSLETVPCGQACNDIPSLDIRCNNGFLVDAQTGAPLDASDSGFAFKWYCQQATCANCQLPGYGSIANGSRITLYSKGVMGCGDEPAAFTFEFECSNSVLLRNANRYDPATDPDAPSTWFTSYTLNCSGCLLPWGGQVAEGTKVNAYKFFGTVVNNCGRGCKVQERKCENGVLGGDSSYDMQSCDNSCALEGGGAPPRLCLLRWQNSFVTPDTQIPMWSKRQIACGDSCQNYFKLSRCEMLTGTFDAPFEYLYGSCTEVCP